MQTSVVIPDARTSRRGGALIQSPPRRVLLALLTALALLALGHARAPRGGKPLQAPTTSMAQRVPVVPAAAAPPSIPAASTPAPTSTELEAGPESPGWGVLLVSATCRALLAVVATLTLLAVTPSLWGWESSVIRSGSMAPAVRTGDVLVIRPATPDQLQPGQVLVVEDPDHPGALRAHRLVGVRPDGRLELKGDANQTADSTPVSADALRGVGVINVPKVGMVDVWMSTHAWDRLAACLVAVLLLEVGRRLGRARPIKESLPRSADAGRRTCTRGILLAGPVKAFAIAALVLAATSASDNSSYAAFKGTSSSTANQISAAPTFYPYREAVLADSPIRYWRMSEGSGTTATDTSTQNRAGTYSGNYTQGQTSPLTWEPGQRSVSFSSGLVTANLAETAPSAWSLEAFIKTGTAGGRIIGFGNGSGSTASTQTDRHLYMSSLGRIVLGVGTTTKYTAVTPLSYNDNAWHHVVGTYTQAGGLRIYVDGTLRVTNSNTPTASPNYTGRWRAGAEDLSAWTPTGATYFVGQLDEIAVYSSALSAARVTAHYNAAYQP